MSVTWSQVLDRASIMPFLTCFVSHERYFTPLHLLCFDLKFLAWNTLVWSLPWISDFMLIKVSLSNIFHTPSLFYSLKSNDTLSLPTLQHLEHHNTYLHHTYITCWPINKLHLKQRQKWQLRQTLNSYWSSFDFIKS